MFKTGEHTDSNGITNEFSHSHIEKIAQNYRERLRKDSQNLAPVVIGHPTDNQPARGWVKHIFRRGNSLIGDIEIVDKDFLESINEGKYRNVSIAVDSDYNFIHLGFLGAVNPAVEGLNPLKYMAFSTYIPINEKEIIQTDDQIELQEKIEKLENEKIEFCKKIAEYERKYLELDLENYVNKLANQNLFFSHGENKNLTLQVLKVAQDLDIFQNSKNKNLNTLQEFLNIFSKYSGQNKFSNLVNQNFDENNRTTNLVADRNMLHLKALELINQNPHIKYEDALNICS